MKSATKTPRPCTAGFSVFVPLRYSSVAPETASSSKRHDVGDLDHRVPPQGPGRVLCRGRPRLSAAGDGRPLCA